MIINITDHYVSKNVLAIMDLIISNDWKRSIHFNFTSANTLGMDLTPYLRQEGPVYRLVPNKRPGESIAVNTRQAYRNLIENADYGNLADSTVHFSYEDHYARIIVPVRQQFNALAIAFLNEDNPQMAKNVLREAVDKLYHKHLRPSYTNLQAAEILLALGEKQLAEALALSAYHYYWQQVKLDLEDGKRPDDVEKYILQQAAELLARLGRPEYMDRTRDGT
jgi:hypothetical protein